MLPGTQVRDPACPPIPTPRAGCSGAGSQHRDIDQVPLQQSTLPAPSDPTHTSLPCPLPALPTGLPPKQHHLHLTHRALPVPLIPNPQPPLAPKGVPSCTPCPQTSAPPQALLTPKATGGKASLSQALALILRPRPLPLWTGL